jgi:hypothetical protein
MEDQNQTTPPAGGNPLNTTPNPEVPPVPQESPVPPVETPSAGASTPALPPAAPPPTYGYAPAPGKETNPWAIVSLIASILSWLGLFGIGGLVGVVAGAVARNQIRDSAGRQEGDGLALAGIIVGAANVILICIGLVCAAAFFGAFAIRH